MTLVVPLEVGRGAHVIAGWQEMLAGLVCVVDDEPSVDAATYWSAFASEYADEDHVAVLMAQRRRASAYAMPSSATAQLHDVADAVLAGVAGCTAAHRRWQGHVFAAGDFLAVWAVEDVVHHLDLRVDEPAPSSALALTRETVEALLGEPLPRVLTDVQAVLVGSGRLPIPEDARHLAARLPALG